MTRKLAFAAAFVAAISTGWVAQAATISIIEDTTTVPLVGVNPVLTLVSGVMSIQTLSVLTPTALYRSPWEDTAENHITGYGNAYQSLQNDTVARWNAAIPGTDTLSLFWGSPDDYNFIRFYNSSNVQLGPTISLGSLSGSGLVPQRGHDLVSLKVSESWAYVLFSNGSSNAFEFAYAAQSCSTCAPPEETPIPGALPLFATGLGALGFITYRRKRNRAV